jgi:hypothetical protein
VQLEIERALLLDGLFFDRDRDCERIVRIRTNKNERIYRGLCDYNHIGLFVLGGSIMNPEFEFVREFLLAMEREETDPATPLSKDQLGFLNIPEGIFKRQVILFDRAGLLETIKQKTETGNQYFAARLTKEGRDFLNEIRDEEIWKRILSIHTEEVQTFSLSVLIALAQRVVELNRKNGKKSGGV